MLSTEAQEIWKSLDKLAQSNPAAYRQYMEKVRHEANDFFQTEYPKVTPKKVYSFRLIFGASGVEEKEYLHYLQKSNGKNGESGKKGTTHLVRELKAKERDNPNHPTKTDSVFLYVNLCETVGAASSTSRIRQIAEPDWGIPMSDQVLDLVVSDIKAFDKKSESSSSSSQKTSWPDLKVDVLSHPKVIERIQHDPEFALAFEYLLWDSLQFELRLKLLRGSCTIVPIEGNYVGDFEWNPEKILMNELTTQLAKENSSASSTSISDLLTATSSSLSNENNNDGPEIPSLKLPDGSEIKTFPKVTKDEESNDDDDFFRILQTESHINIEIPCDKKDVSKLTLERSGYKIRVNGKQVIKVPMNADILKGEETVFLSSKNIVRIKFPRKK